MSSHGSSALGVEKLGKSYFARRGDNVTAEVIAEYIRQLRIEKTGALNCPCLNSLCLLSPPLAADLFFPHYVYGLDRLDAYRQWSTFPIVGSFR